MTEDESQTQTSVLAAGLKGRCPRCGEGALFSGGLTLRDKCERWVHLVLWGLLTPLTGFLLLRVLKATLIAQQYKHKATEGRLAK
jgi:uncharacterized protein (DUF983 family)